LNGPWACSYVSLSPGAEPETNAALKGIRAIARKHGMAMSELALKWAFASKGITSSRNHRVVTVLKTNSSPAVAASPAVSPLR
jgi:aryl-alcohol dehydrogenase-like predicted oxidoreductase